MKNNKKKLLIFSIFILLLFFILILFFYYKKDKILVQDTINNNLLEYNELLKMDGENAQFVLRANFEDNNLKEFFKDVFVAYINKNNSNILYEKAINFFYDGYIKNEKIVLNYVLGFKKLQNSVIKNYYNIYYYLQPEIATLIKDFKNSTNIFLVQNKDEIEDLGEKYNQKLKLDLLDNNVSLEENKKTFNKLIINLGKLSQFDYTENFINNFIALLNNGKINTGEFYSKNYKDNLLGKNLLKNKNFLNFYSKINPLKNNNEILLFLDYDTLKKLYNLDTANLNILISDYLKKKYFLNNSISIQELDLSLKDLFEVNNIGIYSYYENKKLSIKCILFFDKNLKFNSSIQIFLEKSIKKIFGNDKYFDVKNTSIFIDKNNIFIDIILNFQK